MFYFFIFIFHNYLFKYTISLTIFYKNDYFLSLKPKKNKESEKKIKRKNQKKKSTFFFRFV